MATHFAAGATGMMTPQMLAAISMATELSLGGGGVSGGGGTHDEMDVPQSSIGKLIGKGGATIQSIRDQSKAGVQVRKNREDSAILSILLDLTDYLINTCATYESDPDHRWTKMPAMVYFGRCVSLAIQLK